MTKLCQLEGRTLKLEGRTLKWQCAYVVPNLLIGITTSFSSDFDIRFFNYFFFSRRIE